MLSFLRIRFPTEQFLHPAASQPLSSSLTARVMTVIRVACGNFLEMYDFMVFGYYAAGIGRAFFRPRANTHP